MALDSLPSETLTLPARVRVADQCSTSVWAAAGSASAPERASSATVASARPERMGERRPGRGRAGPGDRPAPDAVSVEGRPPRRGGDRSASGETLARRSALGARRSALGARRSALGARRSALGARRSALGARRRRSALGARRSALGARRSALGARRSALGARRSALGARRSALGARRSALGARRSALGARRSALGARRSALGARRSALGARRSALGARRSALGARRSALGARHSCTASRCVLQCQPLVAVATDDHHSALLEERESDAAAPWRTWKGRPQSARATLVRRGCTVNDTIVMAMRYSYYAKGRPGGEKGP